MSFYQKSKLNRNFRLEKRTKSVFFVLAVNNDDAEYMFNAMRELDDEIDIVMNDNLGDTTMDVNDPY